MNKQLNALYYPCDTAGCGSIRTIFPLTQLNATYGNKGWFKGSYTHKLIGDVNYLKLFDIIYIQKMLSDPQVSYIKQLMDLKRKGLVNYGLIYDIDDLPVEIPDYHFSKSAYLPEEKTIAKLQTIFDNVDIFATSTQYLKMKMQKLKGNKLGGCNFQVVPNLIPKYLYYTETASKPKNNSKPRIAWCGSNCHFGPKDMGDLGLIYELVKNTQFEFEWIFITSQIPEPFKKMNITIKNWIADIYSYPKILRDLKVDFGIAPLLPNEFNKCKSNIKCLEYASSGMISLTSDLEPYHKDSFLFLKDNWQETKDLIIDTYQHRREELLHKQEEMIKKFWLEDNIRNYVNLLGIQVINTT